MNTLNPLDHPIVFEEPRLLSDASAWIEHIPFAFLLIDLLRPASIVELGAHKGDSYCAFCQAVQTLSLTSTCAAVDTWKGDAHAGAYGGDVLAALRRHHDPLYSSFSRLIQSEFDGAAPQFADASIDLLHIDGLHTYEAVRHDYETWLPKMSPRAVVLFHDTEERARDFGVWRLWEELATNRPHFHFTHGHGLGVLGVGAEVAPALRPLFDANGAQQDAIRLCFSRLGRQVSVRRALAALAACCFREQQFMNQWKQAIGAPVAPHSANPQAALAQPINYFNAYAADVRAAIQDAARARKALAGQPKAR